MSDIYTLPALVESYGLTIDQWFDKRWNLQDPFKLPYYFRGRRVNLIRGTGKFPERFEVQAVKGQANRPILWENKWEELTVSEKDLLVWMRKYGSDENRWSPLNTFDCGMLDSFTMSRASGPSRFLWHLKNVRNEIAAASQENPVLEENSASWGERIGAIVSGVIRLVR